MSEWTSDEISAFAGRYGVTWLTPELQDQLLSCANKVVETGRAVPRMESEYEEPAHIFRGPE